MTSVLLPTDWQESEVIHLAWQDDISFDLIELQTGMSEGQVIALMRKRLKPASFKLWRKRVTGRKSKHAKRCLKCKGYQCSETLAH